MKVDPSNQVRYLHSLLKVKRINDFFVVQIKFLRDLTELCQKLVSVTNLLAPVIGFGRASAVVSFSSFDLFVTAGPPEELMEQPTEANDAGS